MIYKINAKVISISRHFLEEKKNGGFKQGLLYLSQRVSNYFFSLAWLIISSPFALLIISLRPMIKVYLVLLQTSRIGHFTASTELNIIRQYSHRLLNREFIFFFPERVISNLQLYKMYKRILPILPFPKICYEIDKTLKLLLGEPYRTHWSKIYATGSLGVGRDTEGLLLGRQTPSIYFTRKEAIQAEHLLKQLGIAPSNKIICLLVRDANYLKIACGKGFDYWGYHSVRDSVIENYKEAALYLAEKGYYVLRMGKYVKEPFNIDHPRVIDYANHPLRCDLLDIYLAANCHFMISTSTGLDCVAQIFRRPILFTDVFPLMGQLQYWYPCVLFIPKKLFDTKSNRIMSFSEIERRYSSVNSLDIINILEKDKIQMQLNTKDEILNVVKEMEARIDQAWAENDEDKLLHKKFLDHYPETLIPDKHQISRDAIKIKLGREYAKKNIILLS